MPWGFQCCSACSLSSFPVLSFLEALGLSVLFVFSMLSSSFRNRSSLMKPANSAIALLFNHFVENLFGRNQETL
uniref:Uncharacterized protein n=1 Tax=Kalanchoe fedtschenkoi TaxID=63787 RepID=A0A7N0TR65_KALFE